MIGKTLAGKYRIDRVIGAGGMGSVYAAEDVTTGQRVAVKVILAHLPTESTGLIQRFEREARAAGSIDTEHITRCLDAGTDPETNNPYMVLEYLVGEDLQHLIRRLGPIHPVLALKIVAQACVGLVAAHHANVVHRDIKPANIFLAKVGHDGGDLPAGAGKHTVKLLDFGVAKIRRDPSDMQSDTAGLTQTGSMLGSPLYMSPEQARSTKNVDHRTDIWSMGVVLYQAIAGRTPYEHISGLGDLIIALCSDLPPPVQQFAPWIDPDIAAVVDHALQVDLRQRFQTATEMLDALRALLPDGIEIHDEMMVPLDDATHDHIAPTFFRNLAGALAAGRAANAPSPAVAPQPVEPPPPAVSDSGARPQQNTQSAVATTGPGLGATQPPPRPRSFPMIAIVAASVIAGGAGVYAITRPPAVPAPFSAASGASGVPVGLQDPANISTVSTVATTSAPTAAPPVASVASAATSATAPSVLPLGTAGAPAPSDSGTPKPPASATPTALKPKLMGTAKSKTPDHAMYGDRK